MWNRPTARQAPGRLIAGFVGVAAVLIATAAGWSAGPATRPAAKPATAPPRAGRPATSRAISPATSPAARAVPTHRPIPRPVHEGAQDVTDEQIGRAIQKGADYLYSQFAPDDAPARLPPPRGEDAAFADPTYTAGMDALAVYALLQSGLADNDPKLNVKREEMVRLVEALKSYRISGGYETYAHALRATALALFDRPEDREVLRADAQWLVNNCDGGAYGYRYGDADLSGAPAPAPPPLRRDGSAPPPSLNDDIAHILGRTPDGKPAGGQANQGGARPGAPPAAPSTSDEQARPRLSFNPREFSLRPAGPWDNSNSQYGLLGVWSAAEAGFEVPDLYWTTVERHWTDCQCADGTWSYQTSVDPSYLAMTCAGLASLLVTHDYLEPAALGAAPRPAARGGAKRPAAATGAGSGDSVGRDPYSPPVKKALAWFERGKDAMVLKPGPNKKARNSYTLFGLERVGLASGFKHFGTYDWYKLIARELVYAQQENGSWGDDVIDTSYCLLCLARGRHPVLMTKLRFDSGYWANRPHDAANLARFAGKQLEHPFNWQVVNVERDWTEWNDAPVLEVASHRAPNFTAKELDKIRDFIRAGGLLFTHADGGSAEFNAWVERLAHDLFPQYALVDVPVNHPLYSKELVFNVDPRPPLKMVTNGSRVLMVHSPTDITRRWQQRDDVRYRNAFNLGLNLFVYSAGRRDFRNRLQPQWVTEPAANPLMTVKLARVKYGGNWDPEPLAWTRYSNWLQRKTGTRLDAHETALSDLETLNPVEFPLAHLTGTTRYDFTPADAAAVRAYVRAGGVLLIDACGGGGNAGVTASSATTASSAGTVTAGTAGARPFDPSAEALLAAAFPEDAPQTMQANHPLLLKGAPGTEDVTKRRLRPDAATRLGRSAGGLRILSSGNGHVLYTPLDLTSGLLGINTLGILGYEPAYAQALMKNVVFWTLDGQVDK